MERRTFLTTGALGAGAAALAAPAIAQDVQEWTMVTAWPKNLPGPGVAAQMLADRITTLSGGRLQVRLYAAGELVPGPGVFDAVSEGTADLYHAVPAYWGSKSKGILLFGSQPFGLRADEQVGWLTHGGGQELYDEIYARFGLKPFLCGNSGPSGRAGSATRSPRSMTCAGSSSAPRASRRRCARGSAWRCRQWAAATCFRRCSQAPSTPASSSAPGPIAPLGFQQVAKNYYWPGVGEPSSAEECGVNMARYEALPDDLKEAVRVACSSLYNDVWTEYTTKHAQALQQLVSEHDVQVRKLPDEVIAAMGEAGQEVILELREDDDELVRRIAESFVSYRDLVGQYMVYADNGQMNARSLVFGY